ncbi:AAA family ATPase [Microbacterium resistens]|uniref:MinD/ParA family ATP-binding protein n=1 Tax=Microbacterium resistens TaxID=156977 RepID=UPI001C58B2C9|nr:MinD/ParA family protein [Microbacterium resistens]MBW1637596.1 AAA family ATPase [Microbacterium resistens]
MTTDRRTPKKDDEDDVLGVLDDAGAVDTTAIGILGVTAQVPVNLPVDEDDDLADDDVVDDDPYVELLIEEDPAALVPEPGAIGRIHEDSDIADIVIELPAEAVPVVETADEAEDATAEVEEVVEGEALAEEEPAHGAPTDEEPADEVVAEEETPANEDSESEVLAVEGPEDEVAAVEPIADDTQGESVAPAGADDAEDDAEAEPLADLEADAVDEADVRAEEDAADAATPQDAEADPEPVEDPESAAEESALLAAATDAHPDAPAPLAAPEETVDVEAEAEPETVVAETDEPDAEAEVDVEVEPESDTAPASEPVAESEAIAEPVEAEPTPTPAEPAVPAPPAPATTPSEEEPPVSTHEEEPVSPSAAGRAPQHGGAAPTSKRLGELGEQKRESADLLTADRLLDPHQIAKPEPEGAWNHFVYRVSGKLINLGDGRRARERKALSARISAPLSGGARFVPVLSRKGGVGKTTVTALLGMALADARDDRVIAVDANPDRGTLADRIARTNGKTVRDLVRIHDRVTGYHDISAVVSRDETRLDVLASDTDPRVSEAFSDTDYEQVASVAAHYYSLVLTDTGTGIVHSVMGATLDHADTLVVVAGLSVDEARLASETLTWLETNGYADKVRDAVVVLNQSTPGAPLVRLEELESHFGTRVRHVVRIPYDPQIASGSAINYGGLQPQTRQAARELAALVVEGLRAQVA